MTLIDDPLAPSREEAQQDLYESERVLRIERTRDAAARARGEWVPTTSQRATAAEISLDLTRSGMYEHHAVVPFRDDVYRVDTAAPVVEDHPALDRIRGEHKIVNGVLWIRDETVLPDTPPC